MAEGGDDKRREAEGDRDDRPKSRRRRRGRRGAGQPSAEKPGTPNTEVPAAQTQAASGEKSKSRSRRRKPRKAPKNEPRNRESLPPPRSEPPPPQTEASPVPPAADAGEPKPRERRNRRPRREDTGRSKKPRQPERAKDPKAQPPRWSQLPPPAEPSLAPPPSQPRKPGAAVFLSSDRQAHIDEQTAIDVTPWAADIDQPDGDGTLYNTVVVRGHRSNRARVYDAGDGVFERGEIVGIEGDGGGPGTGVVVQRNRREMVRGRLPRVTRRVHRNEVTAEPRGKRREQEVFRIARHVASTLELPIKIVRSQAEPSGKIVVFFASEERIDFREFYRRVSAAAQGRIELRQVGVRDAAKMLGGIAPCGLQLCCTSFLREFAPVSIKMAKEQGLVLNPQRVSGLCGRLLCCLTYEDSLYRTQRKLLPKLGKRVVTPHGPGKVRDVDVLSQSIRVALETGEIITVEPRDITPMFPSQRHDGSEDSAEAPNERRPRPPARNTPDASNREWDDESDEPDSE